MDRTPRKPPGPAARPDPVTGADAVPGLLGAVHRGMRRQRERQARETALRHPKPQADDSKG